MAERRFNATVSLVVTETVDGADVPFCDSNVAYHGMLYRDIVVVEQGLVGFLKAMTDAGVAAAAVKK